MSPFHYIFRVGVRWMKLGGRSATFKHSWWVKPLDHKEVSNMHDIFLIASNYINNFFRCNNS